MIIKTREDAARMIRVAIAQQGTTAAGLGKKLNLTPPNMSRRINKQDITLKQFLALADALDSDLYIALLPRDTVRAAARAGIDTLPKEE